LADGGGPPAQGAGTVSLIILGFSLVSFAARFVVPSLLVSGACRQIARGTWRPARRGSEPAPDTERGKLVPVFLTKTIAGSAALEGAACACLVAYMIEGQLYMLVLAAVFTAGILAGFPTSGGLDAWLERHERLVNEFRGMPGHHG